MADKSNDYNQAIEDLKAAGYTPEDFQESLEKFAQAAEGKYSLTKEDQKQMEEMAEVLDPYTADVIAQIAGGEKLTPQQRLELVNSSSMSDTKFGSIVNTINGAHEDVGTLNNAREDIAKSSEEYPLIDLKNEGKNLGVAMVDDNISPDIDFSADNSSKNSLPQNGPAGGKFVG